MHELSVALSLIDVINETLIREDAGSPRRIDVTVEVGALCGVAPDALESAFTNAVHTTDLADCELTIVRVPVAVRCDACGATVPAVANDDLRCSKCKAPCGQVVRGRELDVVAVEWEPNVAA